MHSIEPGYGFPIHLHDYADENYLVIGGKGKVVVEHQVYDAETHDVFYIPPGKWHCAFNPAGNKEIFHLFILQAPRVSDELNELGYVEITKSQWDKLGLPKKKWELKRKVREHAHAESFLGKPAILIMASVRVEPDPPWRKDAVIEPWRDGFHPVRVLVKRP